ncbi:Bifunctional purine biosynthesis protein PurH [Sesamum alatum]|uniref:Bifunctional purine biosynthesis protein PurH n=1 Tax=Sesamum alatum TaxID=300844 RepID=A0AAE1YY42_9LAMI|nr:Bifunctional purine biosynthesis protein PurH [Sesamum alatum]
MLAFGAAAAAASPPSTATTTTTAASLSSAPHACITSCVLQPRAVSLFNQLPVTTSYKLTAFRVKAMAETLSTPKLDSKSKVSGKRQALISLSDKTDLALLGNGLQELGFTIVSTGGTASALESSGVTVTKVEELTSFPEMLDGRVKTLHPNIHGGILARRDQEHHMEALDSHGIGTFDVVVVNLYPFYDKVSSASGISFEDGIENIDIGGPAMIRAAAKNHKDVLVVVDSKDYPALLDYLKGALDDQQFRKRLAWKAFQHVASYDSAVSEWLWKQTGGDKFPPGLTVPLSLKSSLRYGENPHQKAAFYVDKSLAEVNAGGIATAVQHHGKEMSYNNYLDADAAWNCVCEFSKPTCVIVKHTNPCGVASRDDIIEAYRLAVNADPVSAFGGIVAFNVEVDEALAKDIREFRSPTDGETRMFYEIVVAPKYSKKGLEVLRGKSKTLRILEASKNNRGKLSLRQVGGGWLAQEADDLTPEDIQFNVVSVKAPEENELHDAQFAWLCVKHVKSNAIVIAKNNCMLGMGSGQPNRLESLRIAMRKAGDEVKGAALASDAFFPFAWNDAVEEACKSGVGIIAEPGGSIRDADAIDCCNKYGVSLVFTNAEKLEAFPVYGGDCESSKPTIPTLMYSKVARTRKSLDVRNRRKLCLKNAFLLTKAIGLDIDRPTLPMQVKRVNDLQISVGTRRSKLMVELVAFLFG